MLARSSPLDMPVVRRRDRKDGRRQPWNDRRAVSNGVLFIQQSLLQRPNYYFLLWPSGGWHGCTSVIYHNPARSPRLIMSPSADAGND